MPLERRHLDGDMIERAATTGLRQQALPAALDAVADAAEREVDRVCVDMETRSSRRTGCCTRDGTTHRLEASGSRRVVEPEGMTEPHMGPDRLARPAAVGPSKRRRTNGVVPGLPLGLVGHPDVVVEQHHDGRVVDPRIGQPGTVLAEIDPTTLALQSRTSSSQSWTPALYSSVRLGRSTIPRSTPRSRPGRSTPTRSSRACGRRWC